MGLESLKFYITVYIVFAGLLSILDIGIGVNLGVPNPPAYTGVAILGDDLVSLTDELKNVTLAGLIVGTAIQIAAVLLSIILYAIGWVFFLAVLLVFWTIPDQPVINIFLLLYRILMGLELIPYIKNLVHPTTHGSH